MVISVFLITTIPKPSPHSGASSSSCSKGKDRTRRRAVDVDAAFCPHRVNGEAAGSFHQPRAGGDRPSGEVQRRNPSRGENGHGEHNLAYMLCLNFCVRRNSMSKKCISWLEHPMLLILSIEILSSPLL